MHLNTKHKQCLSFYLGGRECTNTRIKLVLIFLLCFLFPPSLSLLYSLSPFLPLSLPKGCWLMSHLCRTSLVSFCLNLEPRSNSSRFSYAYLVFCSESVGTLRHKIRATSKDIIKVLYIYPYTLLFPYHLRVLVCHFISLWGHLFNFISINSFLNNLKFLSTYYRCGILSFPGLGNFSISRGSQDLSQYILISFMKNWLTPPHVQSMEQW